MKNNDNPMFDIKGGKRVVLEENLTTGKKMLAADGVEEIQAKRNYAGVDKENINIEEKAEKNQDFKIISIFKSLFIYVLIPLFVAYIVYKFGWN